MIWQGEATINQGKLVIVSGYYGYDNMGDEAILETIVGELKELIPANQIVVLSHNPESTKNIYNVNSINRFDFIELAKCLKQARLFISGGGGLFQDTKSFGSPAYYGLQIFLAKAFNVPVFVFAQGIGPLRGILARTITKSALSVASFTTVRDHESDKLLSNWFINHEMTADPVWCLKANSTASLSNNGPMVGLSLRPSPTLTDEHIKQLANILDNSLTAETTVVLLPLQPEQDLPVLTKFSEYWQEKKRHAILFDSTQCQLPSQWLSIIGSLNFLISMRLHALIMGIASGRPVLGINYDPKVSQLLEDLQLPMLNLAKDEMTAKWPDLIRNSLSKGKELSLQAAKESITLKKLACQNFSLLAKILSS
ncbi:MAG: polysaccharide pyruvyl transferase CsaB [Candidatus Obscuribacterales bacterium]|nr:polysaccharide pyruvyl transferase CsaB [Candidatus Obscuribacterales bacterium]